MINFILVKSSVAYEKSLMFAIAVTKLCKELRLEKEFNLSNQLMRSGNSIAANITEAIAAYSKKEFLCKIYIALKEARESLHWLLVLQNSQVIPRDYATYISLCEEIIRILCKTTITTRRHLQDKRYS